jgi:hypothetical protein
MEGRNLELARWLRNANAVSIHVRRGDYVDSKKSLQFHGLCDISYYQRCIELIEKKIREPSFFVFSDDISWAKDNIRINHPIIFVDHNTAKTAHEDLRLMTHCEHHIISNSSFSWWGAWLCQNPGKIVVAPQQWFKSAIHDTKDLIPRGWETI